MPQVTEVGNRIWNHIDNPSITNEEVHYLDDNNKITEIVLSKKYSRVVCVFLSMDENEVAFISYGEPIEEKINWEEVVSEVEEVHENMDEWAKERKKQVEEAM